MSIGKLNLGMVKAEKKLILKQKQAAAQDARLQKYVANVAKKIVSETNIENNVRVYRTDSLPSMTEYIGNLSGMVSSTENVWAPWSKSFK